MSLSDHGGLRKVSVSIVKNTDTLVDVEYHADDYGLFPVRAGRYWIAIKRAA